MRERQTEGKMTQSQMMQNLWCRLPSAGRDSKHALWMNERKPDVATPFTSHCPLYDPCARQTRGAAACSEAPHSPATQKITHSAIYLTAMIPPAGQRRVFLNCFCISAQRYASENYCLANRWHRYRIKPGCVIWRQRVRCLSRVHFSNLHWWKYYASENKLNLANRIQTIYIIIYLWL